MTFLQQIYGVCMTNVQQTAMTKIIQLSITSNPIRIRKVRHRYAVTTLYTPKLWRIWNYKERHGNATASKGYVAVTLYNRLVCLEGHTNATTLKSYVAITLHNCLICEALQRGGIFLNSFKFRSSYNSRYLRHTYAVRKKITPQKRNMITACYRYTFNAAVAYQMIKVRSYNVQITLLLFLYDGMWCMYGEFKLLGNVPRFS